jgi:hypothetical protein
MERMPFSTPMPPGSVEAVLPGELPPSEPVSSEPVSSEPVSSEPASSIRLLAGVIVGIALICAILLVRITALVIWQDQFVALRAAGQLSLDIGDLHLRHSLAILPLALALIVFDSAVHEGAHVFGGWLMGFRFEAVQIGPLTIRRDLFGLRARLSPKRLFGGSTSSHPTAERNVRAREAVTVAFGPLSSLALAAGAALLERATVARAGAAAFFPGLNPLAETLLAGLAVLSLASFVENIVPLKLGTIENDGMILLGLLLGTRASERRIALSLLRGYTLAGVEPRDRPPDLALRAAALARGTSAEHGAWVSAYSRALDTGDAQGAGVYLDRALATQATSGGPSGTFAHELAFFEARYRSHPALARFWLERGRGDRFDAMMRPRALAAILLLEGRREEAAASARAGLAALEEFRAASGRPYYADEASLRALLADAERPVAEQTAPKV